jgi:hypothetical protein
VTTSSRKNETNNFLLSVSPLAKNPFPTIKKPRKNPLKVVKIKLDNLRGNEMRDWLPAAAMCCTPYLLRIS